MQYRNREYIDYDNLRDQSSDVRPAVDYDRIPLDRSDLSEQYEILAEDLIAKDEAEPDDTYEVVSEDNDASARICEGTDDPETETYFEDTEQMRELIEPFRPEVWEGLDTEERKRALLEFQRFNNELLGLDPSPDIQFYNNEQDGDYGGYSRGDNSIQINEYMLDDALEALDTIAHESRHAYQHSRASNPQTERDIAFAENFADYISPEDDFESYQEQIVEADARTYANRFKNYLGSF